LDNFDKIFSQKLQEEQEFGFRESDWQEVAGRLETPVVAPTTSNWKKWAVAAILLLMSGAIGWLAYQLNTANHTIDELKNQPVADNFRVDTIYKEVAVVRVDTLFQTKTITAPIAQATKAIYFPFFSPNQFETTRFNTHDISVTGTEMLGTSVFSPFFNSSSYRLPVAQYQLEQNLVSADVKIKELVAPSQLEGLALSALDNGEPELTLNEAPVSELTLHHKAKFQDYLRPTGFKVGVSAGKSFLTARDLTHVSSSNFGGKAEVDFVKNVSIVAGVDRFRLGYQTTDFENIGREIPVPDTDILGERSLNDLVFTSVSQQFTQYKLGLKYKFSTKNNVTPYLGFNYLASSHFKKDFYYFFDLDPALGLSVDVDLNTQQRRFNSDGFGLDFGVELMSKNWLSFQIEGYYHFITPEMRSQYYDLVGIRMAALIGL